MRRRPRDERGQSLAVWFAGLLPAFILVAGLAVDGAALSAANRQAQATAAQAARIGSDAAAQHRLAGRSGDAVALQAAQRFLEQSDVVGHVTLTGGALVVTTERSTPTVFVSLIGINHVTGHGAASAELRRS